MNPLALLISAIMTPLLLIALLFGPIYIGIVGAAWIIYDKGANVHPLATHLFDPFYMVDVYSQLLTYWFANMKTLSILTYALPVIALPLSCTLIGIWLARKVALKVIDFTHGISG